MDIFTHTLSGTAAASAFAAFSARSLKDKFLIVCWGAAGAMLPDLDAVTRWSGFDAVIGKTLDLSQTGRSIYYGRHWYSHHNFMHSLAAAAVFTLAGVLIWHLYSRRHSRGNSASSFILSGKAFLFSFFIGYVMHLLGDLPTPGTAWEGIKLFWPLATPVGGLGYIWWWNNYDIFLIFLVVTTVNASLILWNRFLKSRPLRFIPAIFFLCMFCAALFQITHRPASFAGAGNPAGHTDMEHQSLVAQRNILGDRIYSLMNALDRKIPIPF